METMFRKAAGLLLATTAIAIAISALRAEDQKVADKSTPPKDDQATTVAVLKAKLKAGTFKLTEADVMKLLGRPTWVQRPGDAGSQLRMNWEYATYVYVTFKDGKLTEMTGAFSENLPVKQVSLANFKRLGVGMTEPEVVKVLGEGNSTAKVGTTTVRSWGRTARLWVSFNAKGLAFGDGLQEASAVSMPPGIKIPLPGSVNPWVGSLPR